MRIALINENSQAPKNALIYKTLSDVTTKLGFEVDNYGMYSPEDEHWLTYVQNGILASVLINGGAADYIVTGCGTGMGRHAGVEQLPGHYLRVDRSAQRCFLVLPDQRRQRHLAALCQGIRLGSRDQDVLYL